MKYDVSVVDHGTGRVTIMLTLADEGSLKPLDSVDLVIPGQKKEKDGSSWMDLVVSIDMRSQDGKRVGRVHLRKEWAERAEFWLMTWHQDGTKLVEGQYHRIPLASYMKSGEKKG